MAAYKQAKTSADGDVLIETSLKGATNVPLETAEKAAEVAEIVGSLRPYTNPNMASDLTVAAGLAHAAIQGALANVEINLGLIKDAGYATLVRSKIARLQR
jgi:formiminotetrahydrofolate cyclodeaminase